jgi:hypothetical protein
MLLEATKNKIVISKKIFKDKTSSKTFMQSATDENCSVASINKISIK